MNFKKLATGLAAALSLSLAAGAGHAALLSFEDNDIDFVLGEAGVKTTGNLEEGDILVSVFEIDNFRIDGVNAIPAGQELTGVAALQIESIEGNVITFRAVDAGLNSILDLGGGPDVVGGEAGGGATIAMFFNSDVGAANLIVDRTTLEGDASCDSIADCILEASLGTVVQVDGFAGDPDEFWRAVTLPIGTDPAGGQNIGTVAAANNTLIVAAFNAAQTTFFNSTGAVGFIDIETGEPCAAPGPGMDGCVQGGTVSGTITGGQGLTNGAFAHSDFDAQKYTVPEPGALLLLGLGLIALVGFRRRS